MSNPLADNPLRTRTDLQAALRALCAPLESYVSPGGARVALGFTGASFPTRGADLEGFARPLWGLAPLAAGGGAFAGWDRFRRGLESGTDPHHPEYWGEAGDNDQRLVEMAPIGFALALAPEELWDPLPPRAQENLARWLRRTNAVAMPDTNWLFFRVLANLGLERVGAGYDPAATRAALDRLEAFDLGGGWYSDGPTAQRDYYVAFAMHLLGLVWAALAGDGDPARAARFKERAAAFAPDFARWFAADGAALPFGRSLTYRFAQGAFWGALAFAGVEALPWGEVKGLALRHLRWWARRPIAGPDGVLSIGYAYPNLNMADPYNSPGSPYWGLKAFLPLALPDDHPFWAAEETLLPPAPGVSAQPQPGMLLWRDAADHVVALSGGQHAPRMRHGAAKYAKFAYATAFGFSVPSGGHGLRQGAHDSMLALSDDGVHFRVREENVDAALEDGVLRARWRPWPDVEVETWLVPAPPWHVRVHRVRTGRALSSAEGGFALDRTGEDRPGHLAVEGGAGLALAASLAGWSGLRDPRGGRTGQVLRVDPNTNLLHPRTVLPTLLGEHGPGEHWLVCAVLGLAGTGAWEAVWHQPPAPPSFVPPREASTVATGQPPG